MQSEIENVSLESVGVVADLPLTYTTDFSGA